MKDWDIDTAVEDDIEDILRSFMNESVCWWKPFFFFLKTIISSDQSLKVNALLIDFTI